MPPLTNRQAALLNLLVNAAAPVPGQALADELGVTRQVIVHDIALLRAAGQRIFATPKGYLIESALPADKQTVLAVSHTPEQTATELYILVDCGLRVLDVRVEHPVYGELVGNLLLSSRRDVDLFMQRIRTEQAPLLSTLTGGYHYHRVEYQEDEQLQEALNQLTHAGIRLLEGSESPMMPER
ncbi:hypothetical protein C7445_10963 [Alicyclobacillus sacchari]|uniref:Transcriptional regulator n=1 Tax=Alicyclobacillus sacchari TaxID=392010 RepID=A0A4R8LK88_9BACL|nr:transcription repressor NadR [Alicyclobacillus sacchari]TDY44565.1 hypothetical protein C7445_10963 [Alicyclobacillus sacchari]GMA57912.1 transcriptional regulator [Alicyclobacillus sacchari]